MNGRASAAFVAAVLAGAATTPIAAPSDRSPAEVRIQVLARGIIEQDRVEFRDDPSSSIGAKRGVAARMRVIQETSRIPLVPGTVYGIAFRVTQAPTEMISLKAVIETSAPCRLKSTGMVVHGNDLEIVVRVGDVRHIAARIPANDSENPCEGAPLPGNDLLSLFYNHRLVARERFTVANQASNRR